MRGGGGREVDDRCLKPFHLVAVAGCTSTIRRTTMSDLSSFTRGSGCKLERMILQQRHDFIGRERSMEQEALKVVTPCFL